MTFWRPGDPYVVCPRCRVACSPASMREHLDRHDRLDAIEDDPAHDALCDWNLYRDQRSDPELCNLGCLEVGE